MYRSRSEYIAVMEATVIVLDFRYSEPVEAEQVTPADYRLLEQSCHLRLSTGLRNPS